MKISNMNSLFFLFTDERDVFLEITVPGTKTTEQSFFLKNNAMWGFFNHSIFMLPATLYLFLHCKFPHIVIQSFIQKVFTGCGYYIIMLW